MLTKYTQEILRQECAKPDYDGMTVDQAWSFLTQHFDRRFNPHQWPWYIDGETGKEVSPDIKTYCQLCGKNNPGSSKCLKCGGNKELGPAMPLNGFPGRIDREDFNAAWTAAGRK